MKINNETVILKHFRIEEDNYIVFVYGWNDMQFDSAVKANGLGYRAMQREAKEQVIRQIKGKYDYPAGNAIDTSGGIWQAN